MSKRLPPHDYFMAIATAAALRSTCQRGRVGAVLVLDGDVVATGYNGAPHHLPHCEEVGCEMSSEGGRDRCVRAVHAELNVLLKSTPALGQTLYCTHAPCVKCGQALLQRRVMTIYYANAYHDDRWELATFQEVRKRLELVKL